ncbi:fatty acid desaturase [Roseovarius sp. TE539]|uniref:fatty acid desaturase n=1 Tax=Roseovarius sp. TE539 TaxID=2249812 RepID=UPI000DE01032|nr:fatty acid desaturase [Roseovarius sp. TE539]RBI74497.1 fatty acid desaturase [Roseovarius sp. TE539]
MAEPKLPRPDAEWPTLALLVACYGIWVVAVTFAAAAWLPLGIVLAVLAIALHSSLTHEVLHGHPFRNETLNEALVFPCLGLMVPYRRFRDLHLAHHEDSILTDPYDDPESNYMDPAVWHRLPRFIQGLLRINNTLAGRLLLGPAISMHAMIVADWRAIRVGERAVLNGWLLQVPAAGLVLAAVALSAMPFWAYFIAAYAGFSILKIRTFLEHRAHERASGRTVVIEDRGPLALLFLNNNLHVVHHMHPKVAWYRLPRLFAENRERYLRRNDGYYYRSYAEIFRKHFLHAKDPVPHPLWPDR